MVELQPINTALLSHSEYTKIELLLTHSLYTFLYGFDILYVFFGWFGYYFLARQKHILVPCSSDNVVVSWEINCSRSKHPWESNIALRKPSNGPQRFLFLSASSYNVVHLHILYLGLLYSFWI